MLKRMRWYLWVLAGILLIYLAVSVYFMEHFFMGTVVNGENAEFLTVKQVNSLILEQAESYSLTLKERGGTEETLTAEQLGMSFSETENVKKDKRIQNGFLWPRMFWQQDYYQIAPDIAVDEDTFQNTVSSLSCVQDGEQPEDAQVELTGDGYELIPEQQGSKIKEDVLEEQIRGAAQALSPELDLEETGCYEEPSVASDSPKITELTAKLDKWFSTEVTYEFGTETEVVDSSVVSGFVNMEGYEASLNEEAVKDWIAELADRHDTYKKKRSFNSTLRGTITVSGGNYGWQIDQAAETAELISLIKSHQSQTREPVYAKTAVSRDGYDFGNTYIEVDLKEQHLYFYENGTMIIDAPFVSGNVAKDWTTPPGLFTLYYKQTDKVLRGEDYETPVKYWMPFNGGIGLHDANWRGSFGGEIYKTNGSHGCINLPPAKAAQVYEHAYKGIPIICCD